MNIQEAKEQIKRSTAVYLQKDRYGNYRIPLEKQRPVFLVGAPGIGKTAIMAQIASEMKLSFVSYAMTHHTRQSAVGLPFIEHKVYQGEAFDVSVYTLSEIIASVYEAMEKSGKKEGILFLDEINCVSETLAPAMLQFLQYKTFGNHRMPEGWVIVTAGNPHEFNASARSFDIATLDRLKVMNVEPDYQAWKGYAAAYEMHRAILSFLDTREDDFFIAETTVDGKKYVTPRGWEDLSQAMYLYEEMGYPVDETLIGQYLHADEVVNDFAAYYSLYHKYQKEYGFQEILQGKDTAEIQTRIEKASFDEKVAVTDHLLDAVSHPIHQEMDLEESLRALRDVFHEACTADSLGPLEKKLLEIKHDIVSQDGSLTKNEKLQMLRETDLLQRAVQTGSVEEARTLFQNEVQQMKIMINEIKMKLSHLFAFLKNSDSQQEVLLAVTQLTIDTVCAHFIALHGCEEYYACSKALMTEKRNEALLKELDAYHQKFGEDITL